MVNYDMLVMYQVRKSSIEREDKYKEPIQNIPSWLFLDRTEWKVFRSDRYRDSWIVKTASGVIER